MSGVVERHGGTAGTGPMRWKGLDFNPAATLPREAARKRPKCKKSAHRTRSPKGDIQDDTILSVGSVNNILDERSVEAHTAKKWDKKEAAVPDGGVVPLRKGVAPHRAWGKVGDLPKKGYWSRNRGDP